VPCKRSPATAAADAPLLTVLSLPAYTFRWIGDLAGKLSEAAQKGGPRTR